MASAGMTWLSSTWSLILQKAALGLSWWWTDSERGWNTQSLWSQKLEPIHHHFFHSIGQSNSRPSPERVWEEGIYSQRHGNPGPIYYRDGATKQTLKSQILNHYSTAIPSANLLLVALSSSLNLCAQHLDGHCEETRSSFQRAYNITKETRYSTWQVW